MCLDPSIYMMIQTLAQKHNHAVEDNKLYWAWQKGMPLEIIKAAAELWLTDDPEKWSEANNLIFQHTSHFGSQRANLVRPKLSVIRKCE